jgi:membrane-bound ClpP family serine protease
MVLVMLGIWSVYANIHRIPILKNAVQTPPQAHDAGVGSMDVHGRLLATLAGKQGVLATDLRPAGVVTIEGEPYDVVSDGLFLDKGSTVRVIEVRGNRVVVAPVAGVDVTGDVGVDVIGDGDADGDADRGVDDGVNRGVDGGVNRGIDGGAERGQVGIPLLALLVLIGLALVVAEIFFVSFGILAVLSGLALVSAVFLAFTQEGPVVGFAFLSVCAVAVPLAVNFAFKVLPRLPFGKQLYLAGNKHEDVTGGAQEAGISALLDKQGVALCDLRPSGYAQIDGERVDVVTRGEPIEKGSPLRVVKVESNQVIVRLERS